VPFENCELRRFDVCPNVFDDLLGIQPPFLDVSPYAKLDVQRCNDLRGFNMSPG
jgi:hypothetical protein